jgi:four helix bundle protein
LLVVYTMSKADDLQTRTEAFADLSIQFVQGLPNTPVAQRMGNQYLDAATSVAANYRAARRGRSYAEFTAKLGIVLEEADESVFWLKRLKNASIASIVAMDPLLSEAEELTRIFSASARTARRRKRGRG